MSTKKKVAIVYSRTESSWISCQTIVPNLLRSYREVSDIELLEINYSPRITKAELELLVFKIIEVKPDHLVFIDHKPHPIAILVPLLKVLPDMQSKFIFHLYGDFSLYFKEWKETFDLLKGKDAIFVSASERQKNFVAGFLEDPSLSKLCPFPIESATFGYTPELRTSTRKQWGVTDDEFVFVYVGRLSRQKRIRLLLKSFSEAAQRNPGRKSRLILYGLCDNVGEPFFMKWEIDNEYFRKIDRTLTSLPPNIQERITFMGHLPNEQLAGVYSGADSLISLSVHNDEDFGMCVAEAQFCGLQSILTDWAGYAGFGHSELPEAIKYVPVTIGLRNKSVNKESVIVHISETTTQQDHQFRKRLSDLARDRYSIKRISGIVQGFINSEKTEFKGSNKNLEDAIATIKQIVPEFATPLKTISPLYKRLYSAYVR